MTQPVKLIGALPADYKLPELSNLAVALGGDMATGSFIALLLVLVPKADPENRERLRLAFPRVVRAWELWMEHAPKLTAGELQLLLDGDPITAAFVSAGEQLAGLQAFRRAFARDRAEWLNG